MSMFRASVPGNFISLREDFAGQPHTHVFDSDEGVHYFGTFGASLKCRWCDTRRMYEMADTLASPDTQRQHLEARVKELEATLQAHGIYA